MGPLLLLVPLMLAAPTKVEPGETRHLNVARGRHVYVIDPTLVSGKPATKLREGRNDSGARIDHPCVRAR
jgi:hypothetical protein